MGVAQVSPGTKAGSLFFEGEEQNTPRTPKSHSEYAREGSGEVSWKGCQSAVPVNVSIAIGVPSASASAQQAEPPTNRLVVVIAVQERSFPSKQCVFRRRCTVANTKTARDGALSMEVQRGENQALGEWNRAHCAGSPLLWDSPRYGGGGGGRPSHRRSWRCSRSRLSLGASVAPPARRSCPVR
jgi:hypothetical protein